MIFIFVISVLLYVDDQHLPDISRSVT